MENVNFEKNVIFEIFVIFEKMENVIFEKNGKL